MTAPIEIPTAAPVVTAKQPTLGSALAAINRVTTTLVRAVQSALSKPVAPPEIRHAKSDRIDIRRMENEGGASTVHGAIKHSPAETELLANPVEPAAAAK